METERHHSPQSEDGRKHGHDPAPDLLGRRGRDRGAAFGPEEEAGMPDPGDSGGLRLRKRTQGAHARKGSDEAEPAAEPRQTAPVAGRPRAERPSRAEAFEEDREEGFGGAYEVREDEEFGDEEFDDEGRGRGNRVPIAFALLVLFVSLSVVGFVAQQTWTAPVEPEAAGSGQLPGSREEPAPAGAKESPEGPSGIDPSDGSGEGAGAAAESETPSASGGRIEETGLTVSQEDDGQGGLYVTIGDETWHGASSSGENGQSEVLKLEGPTAANINTGFATKDPEAVVDYGSFGIYEPGGGLMYATVQRTKALGAQEATTRGTYSVIGKSGEHYTGNYSDSVPDPETDRVVRVYTVEKGLPPEAGAEPKERVPEPEVETLAVAFELPRLEDEEGKAIQDRSLVPQLVGWHAPDGTELQEIVDAP